MREPKTPLPWKTDKTQGTCVVGGPGPNGWPMFVADFSPLGTLDEERERKRTDAAYAVHAANALPEVLAALRKWVQIAEDAVRVHEKRHEPEQAYQWKLWRNDFRAALAKAEGAPEGGE